MLSYICMYGAYVWVSEKWSGRQVSGHRQIGITVYSLNYSLTHSFISPIHPGKGGRDGRSLWLLLIRKLKKKKRPSGISIGGLFSSVVLLWEEVMKWNGGNDPYGRIGLVGVFCKKLIPARITLRQGSPYGMSGGNALIRIVYSHFWSTVRHLPQAQPQLHPSPVRNSSSPSHTTTCNSARDSNCPVLHRGLRHPPAHSGTFSTPILRVWKG